MQRPVVQQNSAHFSGEVLCRHLVQAISEPRSDPETSRLRNERAKTLETQREGGRRKKKV
jgi:hypothetical protein